MEKLKIGTYIKCNGDVYEIIGINAFGYKVSVINPTDDDYATSIGFNASFTVIDNPKRAKLKEYYYYLDDVFDVHREIELYCGRDNTRYERGNYFLTKEDAIEASYSMEEACKEIKKIINNG